jgi:hypothetical protein
MDGARVLFFSWDEEKPETISQNNHTATLRASCDALRDVRALDRASLPVAVTLRGQGGAG